MCKFSAIERVQNLETVPVNTYAQYFEVVVICLVFKKTAYKWKSLHIHLVDTHTCSICMHTDLDHPGVVGYCFSANNRDISRPRINDALAERECGDRPTQGPTFIALKTYKQRI